jgi:sugar phosphate isomerase/epimerase
MLKCLGREHLMETNRRTFVKTTAAAAIGAAGLPRPTVPRAGPRDKLDRIGVQLYTVRRAMAADFDATLARIASIGYDEVEFAGYFDRDPSQVKATLDALGLKAPSAHVPFSMLADGWDRVLEAGTTVGHSYLICPSLPERVRGSLDGFREAAEIFNRAGERARAAGIQFGYHNHDFEFSPVDGRIPYDILLAETDPRFVTFQLDLFWIVKARRNPISYFARHPGRFSSVHVKDMDSTSERRMVDVGSGTMDFASIFAQRERAGIRHFFVEHDDPADPFESVRASYQYLDGLTF